MELLELFEYQTWADEKVFNFLEKLSESEVNQIHNGYTSIKHRMNHIVVTLEIWYDRLSGFSPPSLPSYIHEHSLQIIAKWRELNTKLSLFYSQPHSASFIYKTSDGKRYRDEIKNVAVHLVNHTTFYRSQIIMMIRLSGNSVENTDYIYYKRSVLS